MADHYILFGDGTVSVCVCGVRLPSDPVSIVKHLNPAVGEHMTPLTPDELDQLGLTDGDEQ
jgi:predicted naringenin-chalcone synthase